MNKMLLIRQETAETVNSLNMQKNEKNCSYDLNHMHKQNGHNYCVMIQMGAVQS